MGFYDIDTPVRINGGLTVNGDTSIPSSYNIYIGGNITGNSNLYISSTITGNIVNAGTFNENGTSLASKYLGINATATNATNFNNLNSGQFLRSDSSSNLSANINMMDSTERQISGNITHTGFFFNSGGVGMYDWKNSRMLMSYNQSSNSLSFNNTNVLISGNNIWTNGNMGSNSGLDADKLDGQHASAFAPSGYGLGTLANRLTSGNDLNLISGSGFYDIQNPTNGVLGMSWHNILQVQTADWNYVNQIAFPMTNNLNNHMYIRNKSSGTWGSWSKVWTDSNMGSGSGLDADTIDGLQGSQIVSNVNQTITSQDWNTLTGNGLYLIAGFSGNNAPSGAYIYGNLEVIQTGTQTVTQTYYTHNSGQNTGIWTRTKFNASDWSVWKKIWTNNNMGSGSGLDADTVDTLNASQFLRSDVDTTATRLFSSQGFFAKGLLNPSSGNGASIDISYNGTSGLLRVYNWDSITKQPLDIQSSTLTWNGTTVWTAGNQGSGSGLDADKLDGLDSLAFVKKDGTVAMTGNLTVPNIIANGGMFTVTSNVTDIVNNSTWYGFGRSNLNLSGETNGTVQYAGYFGVNIKTGGHELIIPRLGTNMTYDGNIVWHSGNMGSGSNLDADKLDGHDSSYFAYVGQNHLFNNMGGGASYDTVDFNTLGTIGEYRFINLNASGTVNKPNDTGYGYYFGMGGGDVSGRGFQLLGSSSKNLYFREMSNQVWVKLWNDQNMGSSSGLNADMVDSVHASQLVRNDTTNQAVGSGFTMSGNAYVGGSSSNGALYIRTGSGSYGIQLAGDNSAQQSGVGSYINANGTANFSGTMTANTIAVTSTALVNNLNAQMINSVKEPQIAKNLSVYELGGMGVYLGAQVQAQGVPNMTVQMTAGTVYTNTGMRVVINSGGSIAFSTPSATYNRIDSVYVQGSSAGANEGVITVMQGIAQSTPVAPTIPSDGVLLANVTIRQNAGSILSTDITDMRVWKPIYTVGQNTYTTNKLYVQGMLDSTVGGTITLNKPIQNTPSNNSITISAGSTSYTWTHNLNLSKYIVKLSWNNPEPHVTWSNKTANAITINLDTAYDTDTIVDIGIEAF